MTFVFKSQNVTRNISLFAFFINMNISLPIHGWIQLIASIALVAVVFFLGSQEGALARNFYLGFAAAVFLTWLITDYLGKNLV